MGDSGGFAGSPLALLHELTGFLQTKLPCETVERGIGNIKTGFNLVVFSVLEMADKPTKLVRSKNYFDGLPHNYRLE